MDLSIIIVNYKTKELTIDAIQSVLASKTNYTYEVILVDNFSNDGSIEAIRKKFSDVLFIENRGNVGFSRANNQAIKISQADIFCCLTPIQLFKKIR